MGSLINDLRFLNPGLDSDLLTGFHFLPTYEEGITIVNRKNAGGEVLPIFEVADLFQHPPEQLKEGYCFTKLKPAGKNKVNRKLRDVSDSPYWKNIKTTDVVVNNIVIGWVTKLVLHWDKNRPTEWHILEYRDSKPDAGRWVLCYIYKREKNNISGSSRGDMMNQVQYYETGQSSNTQFTSNNTYSIGGNDTFSDFNMDDWNGYL